ncbi:MAG: CDP-alcohol phosphatidyltransferase family protein [Ignavibacteria bacterium]|nr:CDP-alcohol phosphatidyltransferase family protein [Ignavibacteria bacterium]
MLRRIWSIATVLSFSRIALLAPLAYFLFADVPNNRVWAAGVMVLAAVTDFLDGYLARRLHQVTDFGKIIDPLADKIAVGVGTIMLVMVGAVQFWYVALVIVRDVLILLGGLYIKSKKNIITQSNWPGKIAVFFITLVMLLSVLNQASLEGLTQVVIWTSVVLMVASFVIYVQRLFVGSLYAKKGHS